MRTDRLRLGTLCNYLDVDGNPDGIYERVVTVVGTWVFTGEQGAPGTVETRRRNFGQDPQTDESAHGYILLPSDGGPFILEPFGAVALGELTPLF